MVQRYEQTRKLQWYKRGAAYQIISTADLQFPDYGFQLLTQSDSITL